MRDDKKRDRQAQIETAAYTLLEKRGYEATSMLAVARAARASNETLYRWYGDKNGLFARMVQANAAEVGDRLAALTAQDTSPEDTLRVIAPVLLGMVLGPRAVALNRAAAADTSGTLGRALADHGRRAVLPRLQEVIARGLDSGALMAPPAGDAAAVFVHLLVGDRQIRRVIGTLPAPSEAEVTALARDAVDQFMALCGAAGRGRA